MKKPLLLTLAAICISLLGMSQAALPTSWNFATTTLPSGWSEVNQNSASSNSNVYPASGNPLPAYKIDIQGDMLIIHVATTPGVVSYDVIGNNTGGAWQGTLIVEESVNGTTWTTFDTPTLTASYTTHTATPNPASRYIRFHLSVKVSGNNVGLDNVSIASGVSSAQEINVKQGTTTIVNGSTYTSSSPVSTTSPINFTIYNLGMTTLNVTGAALSGTAASDFSIVTSTPFTVAGQSNTPFVINFTPSAAGTRSAVLSIANDDVNANPYIINLYGIGGNLATEPTVQPTNLTFPIIKSYRLTASFSPAASAPDGYIILRKTGSAITDVPADGVAYQRGDLVGSSKVVASGTNLSFIPNNIVANTQYYFAIFSYNGSGIYRNYLMSSPLAGNVTSSGSMQPSTYYNSVNSSNASFVTDLHNKISPHTQQTYSNYGPLMITKFASRDTVNNQGVVTCAYSGQNKVYSGPWDWTSNNFSREHTFCHSWMPTYPADNPEEDEFSDYHHLFPTNQNDVNAIRSNYPLGEVAGTPTYTFLGCKFGNNAAGKKVFEPRDSDKGDAARALMYMATCYDGVAGEDWSFPSYISATIPYGQDQNVLKKWHYQDPPDNFEIARNDYVDSLQNNRNPFIDSVQFACYIDFMTMNKINSPTVPCNNSVIGINENSSSNDIIVIAPNPSNGNFTLAYVTETSKAVFIRLTDVLGRVVYTSHAKVIKGYNPVEINIEGLSKGIYSFEFITETGRTTEKLVIE
jgi:endonuclease I